MDRYLFTARSVTHAQQMARELERAGIHVRVRRVSGSGAMRGCGYTLEVSERQFAVAGEILRASKTRPVKVFRVSGGQTVEVVE